MDNRAFQPIVSYVKALKPRAWEESIAHHTEIKNSEGKTLQPELTRTRST